MVDFWHGCGFHYLKRDADGRLALTDDFLRSYLMRPELRPVDESCATERALYQELLTNPRSIVDNAHLAAIADEDARENYRIMLRFRERLMAAPSLEACYAAIFQETDASVPPLFIDHLVQVILRHILERQPEPLQARAAEMFSVRRKSASITARSWRQMQKPWKLTPKAPVLATSGAFSWKRRRL